MALGPDENHFVNRCKDLRWRHGGLQQHRARFVWHSEKIELYFILIEFLNHLGYWLGSIYLSLFDCICTFWWISALLFKLFMLEVRDCADPGWGREGSAEAAAARWLWWLHVFRCLLWNVTRFVCPMNAVDFISNQNIFPRFHYSIPLSLILRNSMAVIYSVTLKSLWFWKHRDVFLTATPDAGGWSITTSLISLVLTTRESVYVVLETEYSRKTMRPKSPCVSSVSWGGWLLWFIYIL